MAKPTIYEIVIRPCLRQNRDCNSDGWPYWQKPAKAASKLMQLIQGDGSWEARYGDRDDVTAAQLRAAYTPLKSLMTRTGLSFELVEAPR